MFRHPDPEVLVVGAGSPVRALPGADPWVRQAGPRIVGCIPAPGDELEALLGQIGLSVALRAEPA